MFHRVGSRKECVRWGRYRWSDMMEPAPLSRQPSGAIRTFSNSNAPFLHRTLLLVRVRKAAIPMWSTGEASVVCSIQSLPVFRAPCSGPACIRGTGVVFLAVDISGVKAITALHRQEAVNGGWDDGPLSMHWERDQRVVVSELERRRGRRRRCKSGGETHRSGGGSSVASQSGKAYLLAADQRSIKSPASLFRLCPPPVLFIDARNGGCRLLFSWVPAPSPAV
ncbi:hypothetical protein ASPZODRAFT_1365938 [Penicilliopsis zonata CBS 506.65]|uniref:Uncharacterized protein n=1 Tax=Penicilliopsis zonata CBS 506.65 TaxID=1073090 RepID=A0A1L9SPJ7_9EURO|nr:hypothetical protein ASPZODRAFT_1365938 [Penicilliopsis zonata CBS 506.65]OJJ48984.1 hypothetical protein ASPZODRAFT_1365938 [Penicilliopsis zonata CBS 506.65]